MRKWRHLKDLGMLKECIFAIISQRKCSSKYSIDRNDLKDLFDVLQYTMTRIAPAPPVATMTWTPS